LPRITLLTVFATMAITLSIPIMAAARVWQAFPFCSHSRASTSSRTWSSLERGVRLYDRLEQPFLDWSAEYGPRLLVETMIGLALLTRGMPRLAAVVSGRAPQT
jgi:hypothetical protein